MKDNKLGEVVHLVLESHEDNIHICSTPKENEHDISIEISASSAVDAEDYVFIKEIGCKVPNLRLITVLNLSHNKLCVVPLCLYILNLEQLDLSHNSLKKAPDCLFMGLETLRVLNLSNNTLGKFKQPLCVRNLESLDISYCNFREVPDWFLESRAVKLHTFIYSGNVTSVLKSRVPPANYFRKFEMQNCMLNDEDVDYLCKILRVTELNLGNERNNLMNGFCRISQLLSETAWKSNIRVLKLNNLGLGYLPDSINCLVHLEELHVESNYLTTIPDEIGDLTELKLVNLSRNMLMELPKSFGKLQNLLTLQAPFNLLIKVDLEDLPRLTYVDLYDNEIEVVKVSPHVKCLDVDLNYLKDPSAICDDYEDKKIKLRKVLENRCNGCKSDEIAECESSSSRSTESIDSLCYTENFETDSVNITVEEFWDVDNEKFQDVSLSDNEYQGNKYKTIIKKTNNYSCEDYLDYLYEDAD